MWIQKQISLAPRKRGFHLITDEVESNLPELHRVRIGLAHILIQHTSASLTLNENADPTVRMDFESFSNRLAKEDEPYYRHDYEGSDDMPAHLKSSIFGASLTLPITQGQFNLGVWQGIYLGEHRNHAGNRHLLVTIHGE